MDSVKQLELIRDAHGDPALLALATVDLTYSDIPSAERIALRTALEAAAVPHWCDAGVLAGLIDDSGSLSHGQWARLKALPVVESFPARGVDAGNVHEASRLAIRKYLAETQPTRFIDLSARSARVFEADTRPVGRIEWIYHLLVADPERGASELEDLNRAWSVSARHQDLAALSAALTELETSRMLQGRPLVRVRLVVAQRRADLEGATSLGDLANQLLQAAEAIDDSPLAGDAYSLIGDVALARGDLAAAEQAFAQDLAIVERLTALDPSNTGWQQNLAVAHSRIGEVALARDDLAAAEQAFAQNPAIFEETQTWLRDHPGQTGERRALLAFVQAAAAASPHDSQSLPEPNPAELRASVGAKAAEYAVGDVIDGRFEILEILGRGSFSKVYRVRDAVEDEERALKLFDNAAGYAAVRREIGALRKIHNPNVVEVFWADKTSAGDWYLVTEFVVGESLDELVTREEAPSRPGSD